MIHLKYYLSFCIDTSDAEGNEGANGFETGKVPVVLKTSLASTCFY
jgi:hypothetical protein